MEILLEKIYEEIFEGILVTVLGRTHKEEFLGVDWKTSRRNFWKNPKMCVKRICWRISEEVFEDFLEVPSRNFQMIKKKIWIKTREELPWNHWQNWWRSLQKGSLGVFLETFLKKSFEDLRIQEFKKNLCSFWRNPKKNPMRTAVENLYKNTFRDASTSFPVIRPRISSEIQIF